MSAPPPPAEELEVEPAAGGGGGGGVGNDKVLAAAQHIVKSLATSKNAADDMIRILSGFDHRFSSITADLFPSASPSRAPAAGGAAPVPPPTREAFEAAEQLIRKWDATPEALVFEFPEKDVTDYLDAVDVAVDQLLASGGAGAGVGVRAAMARMEEELRHLMVRHAVPLDASGLFCSLRRLSLESMDDLDTSSEFDPTTPHSLEGGPDTARSASLVGNPFDDQVFDLVRPEAIDDLRSIAERMDRAGYASELEQVYCGVRRDLLDECLAVLGVERLSIDEVQRMEWKLLNDKMKKWVHGVKTVVRSLLTGERRICDQVLAVSDELRDECFVESTKGCIMQILNFGDAVAVCSRSPEKLSRILDMYEALAEVIPELKELFFGNSGNDVICDLEGVLERLGDAVKGTLLEFGKVLQQESSRRPMMAGEIHPMTRYVMNYLRLLVVYSDTLDKLLGDDSTGDVDHTDIHRSADDEEEYLESLSPLGRHLVKLISYLEANLEEKSKLYEDGALQCIFSMNNILYIVQKVKDSELGRILGDHWIRRRRGKIRQNSKNYLRISWTKVLSFLKDDAHGGRSGSGSGSGNSSRIKEKFKNFNLAFDEIYRSQTLWKVPDPQLREELKISISENVIPAYRAFLGRYGSLVDSGRNSGRYIKYTPEDLENQLSDLFEGSLGPIISQREELRHLMVRHAVPLDASGLFCSLRRLSLESMDDLDTSSEFDPTTPHSLEGGPDTARSASLVGNPFDDQVFDLVRPEAIDDLRSIAERMDRAGYASELEQVYCGVRRDLLDECLAVLGVERLSIDEVQRMEWKLLNDKMKKWVHGVKTVVRSLLTGERRICDQVLAVSDELRDECFVESTKGCIMQILNFGDAVAVCSRSPEKLSRILDMYEALAEVIPELKELFFGNSGNDVICDLEGVLERLGDAVKGTLLEFGKVLQQESSRRPMMAGEIHPMTRYVMNYLRLLVVYSDTLDKLLGDDSTGDVDHTDIHRSADDEEEYLESLSPLGRHLVKLISYLEANLEEKSKLYEDGALQCIFSMNNILYIVQKVKDSELGRILGDHWIRRRRGKIRQNSKNYLRISWTKVLSFLKDDAHGGRSGSGSGSGNSSRIKEKFKNFNLAFDEIYRSQTLWKVPDPQLREELKISISENVIPAYRAFLGRYGSLVDSGRNSGRYIKYTPEDLENQLSDLFEGSLGSANHSRRR
uniref:Exocyst complex subunit Exo70 C-terminal domain-containing protein n=1 Tax=Oryza punctata TaxID=4537 RepID=A0A0E0KPP7_ORYPU